MADLFDELDAATVRQTGGDLLDEVSVKEPTPVAQPRMTQERMAAEARQYADQIRAQQAEEMGSGQAFLESAGRGLATVGRGIERLTGLDIPGVEPESEAERRQFAAIGEAKPIANILGETTGEIAPFLPAAIASVPASLLPRLGVAFGLGATEGAVVEAGKGGKLEDIITNAGLTGTFATAAELALPVFGRVVGNAYRKLTGKAAPKINPDGSIPEQVKEAFQKAGITEEQLKDEAIKTIRESAETPEALLRLKAGLQAGESPERAARASLFEDLGIQTTESRLAQTPEAFLEERQLARQVDDKGAANLRERLSMESQGFQDVATKVADDLGFSDDAGITIKEALESRMTGEKEAVSEMYKQLRESSQGRGIPLAGNEIVGALQDDTTRSLVGRLKPDEVKALNDRLIEFGIDSNPERAKKFLADRQKRAGMLPTKTEITPLNVLNAEEFRQALNSLSGADASAEMRGVVGALKRGIDAEEEALDKVLSAGDLGTTGAIARDTLDAAKRAREAYKRFKSEFGPDRVASVLISPKRGSFDEPQVLASEVVRKMLSPRDRIGNEEAIESITKSLSLSGDKGKKALGDLQAATFMDLMQHATKAKSAKLDGGVIDWSGVNFGKRFDQIGEKRLRAIFRDNPQALRTLEKLRAAGDLKTGFQSVTKSSGTADDLINYINRIPFFQNLLGGAGGASAAIAAQAAQKGADTVKSRAIRKKVKKMIDTSPVLKKQLQTHRLLYPNMLAILGLESIATMGEPE